MAEGDEERRLEEKAGALRAICEIVAGLLPKKVSFAFVVWGDKEGEEGEVASVSNAPRQATIAALGAARDWLVGKEQGEAGALGAQDWMREARALLESIRSRNHQALGNDVAVILMGAVAALYEGANDTGKRAILATVDEFLDAIEAGEKRPPPPRAS